MVKTLSEDNYNDAIAELQSLNEYLDWTTWKECKGCADEEVCAIPIWPITELDGDDEITCVNATGLYARYRL